jgi:hypothetical protein
MPPAVSTKSHPGPRFEHTVAYSEMAARTDESEGTLPADLAALWGLQGISYWKRVSAVTEVAYRVICLKV